MSVDIYDKAVEFLRSHPDQIHIAWDDPMGHPAGILFQVASPTGNYQRADDHLRDCGELCEIASKQAVAFTDEMTDLIREDERIPMMDGDVPLIATAHLELFAEWQRLFDLTWDRNPEEAFADMGFTPSALK